MVENTVSVNQEELGILQEKFSAQTKRLLELKALQDAEDEVRSALEAEILQLKSNLESVTIALKALQDDKTVVTLTHENEKLRKEKWKLKDEIAILLSERISKEDYSRKVAEFEAVLQDMRVLRQNVVRTEQLHHSELQSLEEKLSSQTTLAAEASANSVVLNQSLDCAENEIRSLRQEITDLRANAGVQRESRFAKYIEEKKNVLCSKCSREIPKSS
ncbi:hypothetical protein CYMTET_47459 [Cymbomonas tetramitiformis]|uniref:Uncharacterized protein n=1 Tax=Cymbomonas tetramitiformis TaxID=36881 RepID=A0AAE0BVJ5_9CHLO|nr:hypothetical protein CYMTET_47459 [Cymbomonas tetramitiformis]|eukprot:gene17576-20928_t